jgi:hypothetical protein
MFRGPKDLADVEGLFPAPRSKTPRSKPGRTFLQKAVYHTITYCQVKFLKIENFFVTPLFSVTLDCLKQCTIQASSLECGGIGGPLEYNPPEVVA